MSRYGLASVAKVNFALMGVCWDSVEEAEAYPIDATHGEGILSDADETLPANDGVLSAMAA